MSRHLLKAINDSDFAKVELILRQNSNGNKGIYWQVQDEMGNNLLHLAIAKGFFDLIPRIIKHNPDAINQKNSADESPIDLIFKKLPIKWEIICLIIQHLNSENRKLTINFHNLLHEAFLEGSIETFNSLLRMQGHIYERGESLCHTVSCWRRYFSSNDYKVSENRQDDIYHLPLIAYCAKKAKENSSEQNSKLWDFVTAGINSIVSLNKQLSTNLKEALGLALQFAVAANNYSVTKQLLKAGAETNHLTLTEPANKYTGYKSLFYAAIKNRHFKIIALLARNKIKHDPEALQLAIDGWDKEPGPHWGAIFSYLKNLAGDAERVAVINRHSLLHLANQHSDLKALKLLLDSVKSREARIQILTSFNTVEAPANTPVIYAACKKLDKAHDWEFVKAVLAASPKNMLPNAEYKICLDRLLFFAVKDNQIDLAQQLIRGGASLPSQQAEYDLLYLAVTQRNPAIIKILIETNIKIFTNNETSSQIPSALQAIIKGQPDNPGPYWDLLVVILTALKDEVQRVKFINQHGLLHLAVQLGQINFIKFIFNQIKSPEMRYAILRKKLGDNQDVLMFLIAMRSSEHLPNNILLIQKYLTSLVKALGESEGLLSSLVQLTSQRQWLPLNVWIESLDPEARRTLIDRHLFLISAALQGDANQMAVLLSYGATAARCTVGPTPLLTIIKGIRSSQGITKENYKQCLVTLINHWDIYIDSEGCKEALLLAIEENDDDISKLLSLTRVSDNNCTRKIYIANELREYNLLSWAVHHRNTTRIVQLIAAGAKIGQALQYAIEDRKEDCIIAIFNAILEHPEHERLIEKYATEPDLLAQLASRGLKDSAKHVLEHQLTTNKDKSIETFYKISPSLNYPQAVELADTLNISFPLDLHIQLGKFSNIANVHTVSPETINNTRKFSLALLQEKIISLVTNADDPWLSPDCPAQRVVFSEEIIDEFQMLDDFIQDVLGACHQYKGTNSQRKSIIQEIMSIFESFYFCYDDLLRKDNKTNFSELTKSLVITIRDFSNTINQHSPIKRGTIFTKLNFGSTLGQSLDTVLSRFEAKHPDFTCKISSFNNVHRKKN